jgi:hypothetical protein
MQTSLQKTGNAGRNKLQKNGAMISHERAMEMHAYHYSVTDSYSRSN